MGGKKAFVLGINSGSVEYAEDDAALVAQCLQDYGYSIWPIPELSKAAISQSFDEFIDSAVQNDTLVFYFAGHALPGKLILGDEFDKTSRQLLLSSITDPLKNSKAKDRLLIFDCCHAGSATDTDTWVNDPGDFYRILTASNRLQRSREVTDFKHGFFTYILHQALTENINAIKDDKGVLHLNALHEWLKEHTEIFNSSTDRPMPLPCLYGNSNADIVLAEIKDKLPTELSDHDFNQLQELLRKLGIHVSQFRPAAHAALPSGKTYTLPPDSSLFQLLSLLLHWGQMPNGTFPLLNAIHALIQNTENKPQELQEWLEAAQVKLNAASPQVLSDTAQLKELPALLIQVRPPLTASSKEHLLTARLFGKEKPFILFRDTALHLTNPEIQAEFIEALREKLTSTGFGSGQIMVEFLVPRYLLNEAIDEWVNEYDESLGTFFPVVMRPYERHQDKKLQNDWEPNWEKIQQNAGHPVGQSQFWLDTPCHKSLRSKLIDKPCAGLKFIPRTEQEQAKDFLFHLQRLGTPVAFWSRHCKDPREFQACMDMFLNSVNLGDLPQAVYKLRQQSCQSDETQDSKCHLTLLWDNYNRRMPDKPTQDKDFFAGIE